MLSQKIVYEIDVHEILDNFYVWHFLHKFKMKKLHDKGLQYSRQLLLPSSSPDKQLNDVFLFCLMCNYLENRHLSEKKTQFQVVFRWQQMKTTLR